MEGKRFNHLTLKDRQMIEKGIMHGDSKKDIAARLGKDKSTISKEITRHLKVLPARDNHECVTYKWCRGKKYNDGCEGCKSFKPFTCNRRDRTPGACNGCANFTYCKRERRVYNAEDAHKEYEQLKVQTRQGLNLTPEEFEGQREVIVPLLKQGQSPYAISMNEKVKVCEKTIYNWIHEGYYAQDGFFDVDLPRKVGRRLSKKKVAKCKKRKDSKYLEGRKYVDYKAYMEEHPDASVMYMDTVYNSVSKGPFIQTFKFKDTGFFMGMYHEGKTAKDMLDGLLKLEEALGADLFSRYAEVVVTDRGSEFVLADEVESRPDGSRRCHIFYCDPLQSGQKGSLEQIHTVLRFFLPKKKNLHELGLVSQESLNLVVSHMDSYVYKALKGKTPFQMADFYTPGFAARMEAFGLQRIAPDDVTLKPEILKTIQKVIDEGATLENLEGADSEDESPDSTQANP